MKLLLLDLETSPNLVHVWGLWNQNISISQIMDSSYVMCWAAKWLGTEEVLFDSIVRSGKKRMLKRLHKLMEEADVIIHYNGLRFDIPVANKEFLLQGMDPPAPSQHIDLLKTARQRFKFPSNKLDYVAKALKVGGKIKHAGHELWVRCLNGDKAAWEEMENYNKNDVTLLEKVYYKLLPWIKNHPNCSLYNNAAAVCPTCGSGALVKRGYYYTSTVKYQRHKCSSCGAWSRVKTGEAVKGGTTHVS